MLIRGHFSIAMKAVVRHVNCYSQEVCGIFAPRRSKAQQNPGVISREVFIMRMSIIAGAFVVATLFAAAVTPQKADAQFYAGGGRGLSIGIGTPYYGGYGYNNGNRYNNGYGYNNGYYGSNYYGGGYGGGYGGYRPYYGNSYYGNSNYGGNYRSNGTGNRYYSGRRWR